MIRRVSLLGLAAGLLTTTAGCRFFCGDRCGWLSSRSRCDQPCQLVGRAGGEIPIDPATGQPIGATPGTLIPGSAIPSPTPGARPDELPFPQPSGVVPPPGSTIPPTGLPYAPPSVAPPPVDGGPVGVAPGTRIAQPVRGGSIR